MHDAKADQVYYVHKEFVCEFKLTISEKQFDTYLESLLNVTAIINTDKLQRKEIIDMQKSELLFLYHIIIASKASIKINVKNNKKHVDGRKEYIDLLRLKSNIDINLTVN